MLNKNYNRFERTYEMMMELNEAPLPIESAELSNISDKEFKYLTKSTKLMIDFLDRLGFEFLDMETAYQWLSDELEKREKINSTKNML